MKHLTPFLSLVLIPLLATAPLSAQIVENAGTVGNSPESENLQIRVIAGDTGLANVNSQSSSGFTVEVTSSNGVPIADAAVALRLPDTAPTGVFPDDSHAVVAYTDQSGHAHLPAVKWGATAGVAAIRVTAVKGTEHAGLLLEEKLVAAASTSSTPGNPAVVPAPIKAAVPPPAQIQTATAAVQPATLPKPAVLVSSTGNTAAATHPLTPAVAPVKSEPSVSVTSSVPPGSQAHSHKKWIIVVAAIAAGAGAGLAFAGHGKSSTSSQAPSLTIGAPTVSVGHP